MNLFKRDPFLSVVSLVTALALGAEGWLLARTILQARQARAGLETIRRERDAFQRQTVPPSEESERMIVQELADLRLRLMAAQMALRGADKQEESSLPTKPIEGYFEVANFVEKTRTLATQAHVAIKSDEHFGFGSHVSDGPATELLTAVHAQRLAVQYLMGVLFEAHPDALLSVQRERPLPTAQPGAPAGSRSTPQEALKSKLAHDEPADFFELSPSLSSRVPGILNSDAFALEFSGQTQALRDFLNRLVTGDLPMVVRSVEVERLNDTAALSDSRHTTPDTSTVPIVGQSVSRFRVIVELVKPCVAIEETER